MSLDDPAQPASPRQLVNKLDALERGILIQVAEGSSIQDIAARCRLSPALISAQRAVILEKLGGCTAADAVRVAIEAGLADTKAD